MMDFVRLHASKDVNALRLKYSGKKSSSLDFNLELALVQIEARRKARKKLPSYLDNDLFLFPSVISEEQASNEAVARFHASLVPSSSSILDLTAGLGIDDMEFAKAGISVTACEIDPLKAEVLLHNLKIFDLLDRVTVVNCDSVEYLRNCEGKYDVIFADPARRDSSGGKLHALADCQPDILELMPRIETISKRLIVKASPLLDISFIKNTVKNLWKIYVVCFRGECKEVLIDILPGQPYEGVTVVDLDHDREISKFELPDRSLENSNIRYCDRKSPDDYKYLYEPNAGMMKTADWQSLYDSYPSIMKCDTNTHIFLSDNLYVDFPGRVLEIEGKPDKKEMKAMKGCRINVVARNYPLSAPEFTKKYGIISGGNDFLYALRFKGAPMIVSAHPVKQDQV